MQEDLYIPPVLWGFVLICEYKRRSESHRKTCFVPVSARLCQGTPLTTSADITYSTLDIYSFRAFLQIQELHQTYTSDAVPAPVELR